jgi:dipeptide/tripeptide permease
VADSLPFISYALCLVEFAERASYYGVQTIFNNFIEFPLPAGELMNRRYMDIFPPSQTNTATPQVVMAPVLHRLVLRRLQVL